MRDVKKVPLNRDERANIYASCSYCSEVRHIPSKNRQALDNLAQRFLSTGRMPDVQKVKLTFDERTFIYAACEYCSKLKGLPAKERMELEALAQKFWYMDTTPIGREVVEVMIKLGLL